MYEHLPVTATKEEVLAALDNKCADGVILEYPLNELPKWVFEVGNPEMDPVPVSRVKLTYHTYNTMPKISKFNLITGMTGTGKTNVVNLFMKKLIDDITWPHFHIAHIATYGLGLWAANGEYPVTITPFVDDIYRCYSEGDMLAYINDVIARYGESKENHVLIVENVDYVANIVRENFWKGYVKAVDKLKKSNITTIFTAQNLNDYTVRCSRDCGVFCANGVRQLWCTRDMYLSSVWKAVELSNYDEE